MSVRPTAKPGGWRAYGPLLRYALAEWRGWAWIFAVTLMSSAFGLLGPWPMRVLLDNVLGHAPMPGPVARFTALLPGADTAHGLLVWVALAGVAVFAVNAATDIVLTRAWVVVGQRTVNALAADLFAAIQRRSLLFHSRNSVGDSLSRITGDSWCVYKAVDAMLFTPKYAIIMIVGMLVIMAQMDPGLTLLAVAVAPVMALTAVVLGRRIRKAARRKREFESRIQALVQQTLAGLPVVQAFAQERRQHRRFRAFTRDALRAQRRTLLVGRVSHLTSGLTVTLGTGAVLWLGARHVQEGRLSLGALTVFLAYLSQLQTHLKSLTGVYSSLQEIGATSDRVLELLKVAPEVEDRPGAAPVGRLAGHVRLEGVTFGYEPGRPVLQSISLDIPPGATVAVVGPTGAGKSTLAGLVPRFFDPWEGRVLLDGRDARDLRLRELRDQIGVVLQEPFLLPITIAENIAYSRPDASRDDIEVAARAANIHDFITTLPDGYDTLVGERGTTLSGGEQQRLGIARALLKNAPVLILDEPTSALDAETERLFLQAVTRLMRGRTTLVIAHRLSTVRHADCIVILQHGTIVEAGSHDELLAAEGRYARLYRFQSGERPAACSVGEVA
jgi:ATP-binding cassette subfamily B protein/subfamily B ATP-binding cassette protein MsbA